MPDLFKEIYSNRAAAYEKMVSYEDYQGNILRAIREIRALEGLDVIELGAGTGRMTALLAPYVRSIRAFDASAHMLAEARRKMEASGLANWQLQVADNRNLPVENSCADLALAGWSLAHSVGWYPDTWRLEIRTALDEMERVLRPAGTLILLETLGTGRSDPQPPTEGLAEFYGWLEGELGFARSWIRTDYRFDSPEQAADLTRFFFGDELAAKILARQWAVLPECTGIWYRQLESAAAK